MTDYRFFEQSLAELRTYRVTQGRWIEELRRTAADQQITILSGTQDEFRIRGSHAMRTGNPVGVAQVNERFNIRLPAEVDEFYRRWDGGTIVFQQHYTLFSAAEVIKQTQWVRELQRRYNPPDLPWHLVRLGEVENGDYLGLRLTADNGWDMVFVPAECSDHDLIDSPHGSNPLALDSGFCSWLRRMCDTDGWPVSLTNPRLMPAANEGPPARRIPNYT